MDAIHVPAEMEEPWSEAERMFMELTIHVFLSYEEHSQEGICK